MFTVNSLLSLRFHLDRCCDASHPIAERVANHKADPVLSGRKLQIVAIRPAVGSPDCAISERNLCSSFPALATSANGRTPVSSAPECGHQTDRGSRRQSGFVPWRK
jgi:hypothetical protein